MSVKQFASFYTCLKTRVNTVHCKYLKQLWPHIRWLLLKLQLTHHVNHIKTTQSGIQCKWLFATVWRIGCISVVCRLITAYTAQQNPPADTFLFYYIPWYCTTPMLVSFWNVPAFIFVSLHFNILSYFSVHSVVCILVNFWFCSHYVKSPSIISSQFSHKLFLYSYSLHSIFICLNGIW